ncbi:MAG: hypothetical protein ACRC6X_02095 [Culicoidibacterales bacterium]
MEQKEIKTSGVIIDESNGKIAINQSKQEKPYLLFQMLIGQSIWCQIAYAGIIALFKGPLNTLLPKILQSFTYYTKAEGIITISYLISNWIRLLIIALTLIFFFLEKKQE